MAPKRSAAPHLVEPQLKHITDVATFVEFHKAHGFQYPGHSSRTWTARSSTRSGCSASRSAGAGRTCGDFERELTVPGGASVPTAAVRRS